MQKNAKKCKKCKKMQNYAKTCTFEEFWATGLWSNPLLIYGAENFWWAKIIAAAQICHTDTSSANANITAATRITHTDTCSANANITAAPQICHTDTSSANADITAATQITLTAASSANAKIIAAAQICHTDTSSANANITAATQICHTDTSSANANIIAATRSQLDTLPWPLLRHSPLWRALRLSRKRLPTVASGCRWLRSQTQLLANTASPPDPQVKREPSHSGFITHIIYYNIWFIFCWCIMASGGERCQIDSCCLAWKPFTHVHVLAFQGKERSQKIWKFSAARNDGVGVQVERFGMGCKGQLQGWVIICYNCLYDDWSSLFLFVSCCFNCCYCSCYLL